MLNEPHKGETSRAISEAADQRQPAGVQYIPSLHTRYPHLSGYFTQDTVGLVQKSEAIEIAQKQFFEDQRTILDCKDLTYKAFIEDAESRNSTFLQILKNSIRESTANSLSASGDPLEAPTSTA